ncbi:hypothetical protein BL253_10645 [Pseudofrankia asymbiotica]|uniref:Uncharacterized protein n=1 Tax=Pseudofrankia asymbiotica TaxID=1834516 RepID=A0A1V2IDB3_9ACTN|nr:hypothetical protein BL253_10645 [Pseudofrankia asymbiotica]
MSQDSVAILAAVLVPVATAAVGALGLVLKDWREGRAYAGRRRPPFEDAARQVSFAVEWWQARQTISSPSEDLDEARTRALAWLEEASALVTQTAPAPGVSVRRLLLLAPPLHDRLAKVIRLGFYLSVAVMVFFSAEATAAALGGSSAGDVSWTYVWSAVFGALSLILRYAAVATEAR